MGVFTPSQGVKCSSPAEQEVSAEGVWAGLYTGHLLDLSHPPTGVGSHGHTKLGSQTKAVKQREVKQALWVGIVEISAPYEVLWP